MPQPRVQTVVLSGRLFKNVKKPPVMLENKHEKYRLEMMALACKASGRGGLECLKPACQLDASLQIFFCQLMLSYLNREMGELEWQAKARGSYFTLSWRRGARRTAGFQLRFAPSHCRWLLMKRGFYRSYVDLPAGLWFPHQPDRSCLSLSDWLGQVRKLITGHMRQTHTI